jgi:hypothetical protein
MFTLVLGAVLIVVGAISISFPQLCRSLKDNDEHQWKALGSPMGLSFTDLGKTIGVYNWILDFGFEKSANVEINNLGKQALKKALFAKYTLLWGCLLLALGFFAALLAG